MVQRILFLVGGRPEASQRKPAELGLATLALVLMASSYSLSCHRPEEHPVESIHYRWIEEEPQDLFSYQVISKLEEVDVWRSGDSDRPAAWRTESRVLKPRRNTPELKSQVLRHPAKFAADDVDVIEVAFQPIPRRATLSWTARSKGSKWTHSLTVRAVDAVDGTFRFVLAPLPEWRGKIRRPRLTLTTSNLRPHRVVRSRGLRFALQGDLLSASLRRPWKVALHGDLRNAWLNLPGTVIEREVSIPEHARLELSYTLPATARIPVGFQVLARDSESAKEAPQILFEDSVAPDREGGGTGWRRTAIDLGRFAGRSLTLQLANSSDGILDPLDGMPAWGNPEIYAPAPEPRPPNIVLISLDTLRADHLSIYGYPRQTSPNIDRWARESGVVFRSAVTSAPWTLPSHVSLLTGIDALRHGINHSSPAPARLTMLAEILRRAGYSTAAVTGGTYLHPKFGLAQGFDYYRSSTVDRAKELADGMARTTEWLTRHGHRQPFFLFFHTYEIHDPYEARQPYFERFASGADANGSVVTSGKPHRQRSGFRLQKTFHMRYGDRPDVPLDDSSLARAIDRYDSSIAYVDAEVGKLLRALEELALADDTLVILTSDHGEALGEHQLAGHGYLYDDNLLVPLIIADPRHASSGLQISEQVRLIDVLPTVLELAGLEAAAGIDGRSLVPLLGDRPPGKTRTAFSYSGHYNNGLALRVNNRFKYIFINTPWRSPQDAEELFRLAEDPGELHDVTADDSGLSQLRRQTASRIQELFSGLSIVLRNVTEEPVKGRLAGDALSPFTVRTVQPGATCKWHGARGMTCALPPNDSLELLIENIQSKELSFSGSWSTPNTRRTDFETTLQIEDLIEPKTLRLDRGEWELIESRQVPGASGLTFAWVGEQDVQSPSPVADDSELRKQLEALGYID